MQDDCEGKDNCQFTITGQSTANAELRKREVYWQRHLKAFFPNGLNECLKNLVYKKLARQKINCFVISVLLPIVLIYCYHYGYHHYCHYHNLLFTAQTDIKPLFSKEACYNQ